MLFHLFFYFGVIWDRRINVSFTPLCRLKWKSPCNQNSLNALWMLGTDFCAWVQTWLGPREPQSCWKNMPITNSIWYVVCSVQFSCSVMSDSLQPHGLQHARARCSSPTPGASEKSFPSSWWFHPTISSSVILSPPAFSPSQHQDLFQWVGSLHQVAKVLEFQHQSFQWIFRIDFL